jgi:hypothetical protein
MASVSKEEPKVGGITHSQASYPTLTSVLLTLQVAIGGRVLGTELSLSSRGRMTL